MADAWREAIRAAERAVRDRTDPDAALRATEKLLRGGDEDGDGNEDGNGDGDGDGDSNSNSNTEGNGDRDSAEAAWPEAWASALPRLTALLERLGCREAAAGLVARAAVRLTDPTRLEAACADPEDAARLAVVLAEHGYPERARTVAEAVAAHPRPGNDAWFHANAAAASLLTGEPRIAEELALTAASTVPGIDDPALRADVELLRLSVVFEARRQLTGVPEDLLPALEAAVREVVARSGGDHPRSLSALVTLATAELHAAKRAGSAERMERAAEVLAAAAQRTSATLGAGHPQTASAFAHLAAAEAQTAHALGAPQRLADARRLLAAAEHRLLEHRLGCPLDADLLAQALTHRSYAPGRGAAATANGRLEILGDSVLGLVVTDALYRRRPALPEGQLIKWRAAVLTSRALAGVARRLRLGAYLRMGAAEEDAGLRDNTAVLADALAALIGAVHLDRGLETAAGVVHRLLDGVIEEPPARRLPPRLPAAGPAGASSIGPAGASSLGPAQGRSLPPVPQPPPSPGRAYRPWADPWGDDDPLLDDDNARRGPRG